ncbi:MAG: sulfite exporter TauE/SafE family protein [Candidatus Omnitrophica bacterium]|jgi:thiol:disulfide interchange protein DsbD|nr:sulfite exporter TauE/SafE family protein [Candidatus Omnitrophota bacterium]
MNLSGGILDYLIAFLGGVLLSLTPCVYPLLPVSLSYIGISCAGSKLKGFLLGLAYSSGLAFTYMLLGILASLTGKVFGTVSSHPVTQIIIGLIVILFGAAMFDLVNLPFLNITKSVKPKGCGYSGVFVLGITSALVITPCVSPVLGSILLLLAAKQNVFYGASLLLSFAYGLGMIFILAGFLGSVILSMPKSGKWMFYAKRAAALILLIMGAVIIFSGIRGL